jgi:hypothetical protein
MCRYISVVVPGTVRTESLEAWALSLNLGFTRYENPHVRAQLQPGEVLALATRGHCDCSSPVGSASNESDDAAAAKVEADTRRMRRLGWSEAKIHRVLDQKAGAAKRPKGAGGDGGAGLEEWAAFLRGARSHGNIERIGVFWHMYHGRIDDEDFRFVRARSRSISDLTLDDLARLQEDVLHEFTPSR